MYLKSKIIKKIISIKKCNKLIKLVNKQITIYKSFNKTKK